MRRAPLILASGLAAVTSVAGCAAQRPASTGDAAATSSWRPHSAQVGAPTLGCSSRVVAAGDIVKDEAVADRTGQVAAGQQPDLVLTLGDNQYPSGSLDDYRRRYDRTVWGRLKPITNPVPGNHEYQTPGASGYFTYFGDPPAYYGFDAGCGWRGYALNSEVDLLEQAAWLERDLAAHPGAPVLAYWHKPRWSSGTEHGGDERMQALWVALAGRTGVVLGGHEHNYERFAPVGGLRQFVVGTGGTSTYPLDTPAPGSESRISGAPGVLRLDLHPGARYEWAFLDTVSAVRDSGSG